ncbi:hypothetical protein GW17_00055213 [Ensete ventricosum]|nr:hypothetical protein GW17_00055213 [Ensete ventricosum]
MATVKAARPPGVAVGERKEPAKAGDGAPKAPRAKQAPKKPEKKPRELKRKKKVHQILLNLIHYSHGEKDIYIYMYVCMYLSS